MADYELLHAAAARLDREAVPEDATNRVALLAATYRLRVLGARSLLRMGLPDLAFRVLDGDWPDSVGDPPPPPVHLDDAVGELRRDLVDGVVEELLRVRALVDGIVGTPNPLTDRQTELVALLADGLSLEQAASRLHLTRDTVKRTVERAFAATGTHRQPHLVAVALRGRWIA